MELVMDIRMLNKNATQNPSTLNPVCKIFEAIKMIAALITRRKNPRETTVIGNVRNTNMGFRYIFKSMMTKETSIA
jgi:hypothetical protein